MPSTQAIWDAVTRSVALRKDGFRLHNKSGSVSADSGSELNPGDILLPFIEGIDSFWSFETEPDSRTTGSIVEILRACSFYKSETGEIEIIPDKRTARMLGAYDTPEPIVKYLTESALDPLCNYKNPPIVLDPACGAGYFLLAALDFLVDKYPDENPVVLAEKNLRGIDIDPVAIALSKRNLSRHSEKIFGLRIPETILNNCIFQTDALDAEDNLRIRLGSIDAVIGNPPYQFYSGRGSPVASLRREGKHDEADRLSDEINALTKRFPMSSHECRDRYKWFINRAIQFLRTGGRLGFITPNTWIVYPRYRDIRRLLAENGRIEEVIDFGSFAFKRAHVPAATLLWEKSSGGSDGTFPLATMDKSAWERTASGDLSAIKKTVTGAPEYQLNCEFDIVPSDTGKLKFPGTGNLIKALLDKPYNEFRLPLSDVCVIREGSHAIPAVQSDTPQKSDGERNYPVLVDKKMAQLVSPELGYIEKTHLAPNFADQHSGPRFLLRKTGDHLIVAPSPTDEFALAHQNVYVCKLSGNDMSFHAILGILASELITDLYRAGPGGQRGRQMAQFRIHYLNRLPIVVVPKTCESNSVLTSLLEKISELIRELTDNPDESMKHELDRLVYDLYSESMTK